MVLFSGVMHPLSRGIFKIQKIIIKVMSDVAKLDSFRDLFKGLQILPLQSQHNTVTPVPV
jgi:hypothetical protein